MDFSYKLILALFQVIPVKESVPIKPRKPTEQLAQGMKTNSYSDRNPRRAGPVGYVRNNIPGNTVF